MGARSRSVFLASLVPAVLLGGVFAVVQAQNAAQNAGASAKATRWSDPATWPNNKVPAAGDTVAIAKDKNVILDVNTPALGGVTIDGKLSFADNADVELTTEWIMLHGELAIGTEARPHARKATITFTDNVKGENIMAGMGDRGIMISGGTLNLHGSTTNSWTKLSATANAGATSIQVLMPGAGKSATRSSSPRRTTTPGRRSVARLPPSAATRSRSTRSWTTCTSARSPSTWTSAAKWAC